LGSSGFNNYNNYKHAVILHGKSLMMQPTVSILVSVYTASLILCICSVIRLWYW